MLSEAAVSLKNSTYALEDPRLWAICPLDVDSEEGAASARCRRDEV